MKQPAYAFALVASALSFAACGDADPIEPGGGAGEGGSGSQEGGAGGASSGTDSGASGGGGSGGAPSNDCPRARIEVPNGEVLNVRPDPSTANAPVGTLVSGEIVDVVEQVTGESVEGNDVWFSISNGAVSGYVSSVFASCTTDLPPEPPDGYYAPIVCGTSATVTQGNNGSTSHNGTTSQYASTWPSA